MKKSDTTELPEREAREAAARVIFEALDARGLAPAYYGVSGLSEVQAKDALIAELVAALEPLAACANAFNWNKRIDPNDIILWEKLGGTDNPRISVADARRARAVLAKAKGAASDD